MLKLKGHKEFNKIFDFVKSNGEHSSTTRKNAKTGQAVELNKHCMYYKNVPYFVKKALSALLFANKKGTHEYINNRLEYHVNNEVWCIWIQTPPMKGQNWMRISIEEEPAWKLAQA